MTQYSQQSFSTNLKHAINAHAFIKVCFSVSLISATQAAIADAINCGTPSSATIKLTELEQRPPECLQDPGWFDVSAGIAVIQKANSLGENASGNLVALRAYPFGRWYAPLKSVSQASSDKIAASLAMLKEKQKKTEQINTKLQEKNPSEITTQQQVNEIQQEVDKAANDVALSMQAALNDFGSMYAVQGESKESSYLLRRISLFYGRSVGGFDANVVQGDVNAFGIAYHIAPQFAVIWGRAYYNQAPQNGITKTSSSNNFFGIQLNLNAFKAMRNITGSM